MSFADGPVFPGDPATLRVSASPGSLCGIGVVDKSVLLLGGQNQLTLEQVYGRIYQQSHLYIIDVRKSACCSVKTFKQLS